MPPYSIMHWQYLILFLLGGVLLTGLIWLAVKSPDWTFTFKRKAEEEYEESVHEFGEVKEGHRPMPVFLVTLFVAFVTWALFYTLYSAGNFPY